MSKRLSYAYYIEDLGIMRECNERGLRKDYIEEM
jgi:hypothetical protein